jgi:cyclopropane fatty-acyl-phospholipid synthase-like methyltransferase
MKNKEYLEIISHYELCLQRYGDTHLGVDWPKKEDTDIRYQVMLEVIKRGANGAQRKVTLLDFGCGASHLYEYILTRGMDRISYSGLDLSEKFIELSKSKFPAISYYRVDLLDEDAMIPNFDYIVMNGVFTEKCTLSFDEMFSYFKQLVKKVFEHAKIGMAFNVMSKHVDWERDDLFHLPFDMLGAFLTGEVSRNFVIRHDYRLYEYTTYVYR